MSANLNLKEIYLGKADAKDEVLSGVDKDTKRFFESFLFPDDFACDEFLNSKKVFIKGYRGTGKTALLRYISLDANEKNLAKKRLSDNIFILFKSDFDRQRRPKSFANTDKISIKYYDPRENSINREDYLDAWLYFLHRKIVEKLKDNELVFKRDKKWKKYVEMVEYGNPYSNEKINESIFKRMFPKMKGGFLKLPIPAKETIMSQNDGELKVEFEWKQGNRIFISDYIRIIENYFNKVDTKNSFLDIFIDELELTHRSEDLYKRDTYLIAGLIQAVAKFHKQCVTKNIPINVICAVRTEIVDEISNQGFEINKCLDSYAKTINWSKSVKSLINHPLIHMIAKKIKVSEESKTDKKLCETYENIFYKYFPKKIGNLDSVKYILRSSWYRPREIIYLINECITKASNEYTQFSENLFYSVASEYAKICWNECKETLSAFFKPTELKTIETALTGICNPFSFREFNIHIEKKKNVHRDIENLFRNHGKDKIIEALYIAGVICNRDYRSAHNNYPFPNYDEDFFFHKTFVKLFCRSNSKNNKYHTNKKINKKKTTHLIKSKGKGVYQFY